MLFDIKDESHITTDRFIGDDTPMTIIKDITPVEQIEQIENIGQAKPVKPIAAIKPTKPKAHVINGDDWDRYDRETRRKIQEQNDAEWDRFNRNMIRYTTIMNANNRSGSNNNYMFDNLNNDVINDITIPYFEDENKRIEWLRSQPTTYTITPSIINDTAISYTEDENNITQWLGSQPTSFIITQSGINEQYLEACRIYCMRDSDQQKILNDLRKETTKQEVKLIKATHRKRCVEIKKDTIKYIRVIDSNSFEAVMKNMKSFKRIRCIRDKTS